MSAAPDLRSLISRPPPPWTNASHLVWGGPQGTYGADDNASEFMMWQQEVASFIPTMSKELHSRISKGLYNYGNPTAHDRQTAYQFLLSIAATGRMRTTALQPVHLNNGASLWTAIE
jgi:hypothetical protein